MLTWTGQVDAVGYLNPLCTRQEGHQLLSALSISIAKEHLDPTAMTNNSDEPMDDAFIDTLPDSRATRFGEK